MTRHRKARTAASPRDRAHSSPRRTPDVGHDGRYTPPTRPTPRFRPQWHKAAGGGAIAAGLGLFFVCQLNIWGIHRYGGHVWYVVGLALAASSVWWFGAFDPAGSGFQ